MFWVDVFVQGSHVTAMDVELFSHSGVEERFKYLECRVEDPILIYNMKGGCSNGHGGLQAKCRLKKLLKIIKSSYPTTSRAIIF